MSVILSRQQFAKFEDIAREKWGEETAHKLHATFDQHYTAMGASPTSLIPMVRNVAAWTRRYDISSKADVTRLCYVAASLGHRFWQDPRFRRQIDATMGDAVPPSRRASAMTKATKEWLRSFWADDDIGKFAARLVRQIDRGQPAHVANLRYIVPAHWQLFAEADNEKLLAWLGSITPDAVRTTGPQHLAFTACALVHGMHWYHDPQYPRLTTAIGNLTDPAELADTLRDIYTEAHN